MKTESTAKYIIKTSLQSILLTSFLYASINLSMNTIEDFNQYRHHNTLANQYDEKFSKNINLPRLHYLVQNNLVHDQNEQRNNKDIA